MRTHHEVMQLVRRALPPEEPIGQVFAIYQDTVGFRWCREQFSVTLRSLEVRIGKDTGHTNIPQVFIQTPTTLLMTALLRQHAKKGGMEYDRFHGKPLSVGSGAIRIRRHVGMDLAKGKDYTVLTFCSPRDIKKGEVFTISTQELIGR